MATIFQVFDLKEAALSGAKQQATERRYLDGGFEAPRNSLDVSFETAEVSRSSIVKPDDIPFGYEYYNPGLAASIQWSKKGGASHSLSHGNSPRKRAPNVVARLMGLEALPDELPAVRTRKFSQPGTPTGGSPKPTGGLTRQRSQGAVSASRQRPPLPRQVQRASPANVEEERVLAPVLSFRDHPQEEQLQKFKKEFEAKQQAALAKKQEQFRTLQLKDMNRELEEKKEKVRATLDKAKSALSRGIEVQEPSKRLNGQGQFEESKEFLDAMEFLQSNKDFIFQFLQQKPEVTARSNENSNATTPLAHLKSAKKGKGGPSSPRESSGRKREGFSPRAFARLFMNPRKWHDSKQQPATTSAAGIDSQSTEPTIVERCSAPGSRRPSTDVREMLDEVKLRTSSSTNSRSELLPPPSTKVPSKRRREEANSQNKSGSRDVIMKIIERLRQREQCDSNTGEEVGKEHLQGVVRDSNDIARKIARNEPRDSSQKNNFTRTEYFSTGKRVSIRIEDMEDVRQTSDGEEVSTPLVKIVRENARRSSISLPSSPHLSARSGHNVASSSRVTRKRATEKPGTTPPANPTKPVATIKEAKNPTLTSESPRRRGSQVRGSLLSNIEVEKSLRKSASVNENASRSKALNQRVEASVATSRKCVDQNKESASNLTRCRSIPNVALLQKRGQCTSEAVQKVGSRRGVHQSDKFLAGKNTAKTTSETPKHMIGQKAEKTKGFFSGGRKKVRDGLEALPTPGQQLLLPSATTPVLARFVALAESCVSQTNTLSDADNAVEVKLHIQSIRSADAKKGKENPRAKILPSEKERYPQFDKVFSEPSPAEAESVVSESSAESDAGSCDDKLLEVLSQLPPLAKSTAESLIVGEALPSTVFVPRAQQQCASQVQIVNKSPKPSRAWTTARNISNKVQDEQDSNSDNNGQPSPVSVLEAPFEEESPNLEFNEITNDLQGLRIRLRPPKAEGGEKLKEDLEHAPEIADTPRVQIQHRFLDSARENQTLTTSPQRKINASKPLISNRQFATTGGPNLQDLPCPASHEADLAFVSNILVGSDFITHGGRFISKWHSAVQPISPRLFEGLEASHSDKKGSSHRRILFDAINEILAKKLRPQCYEPWTSQFSGAVRTGRRLVEDVWNEIFKRQFPAPCHDLHGDYVESLVAQDLKTSTAWMSLHHDVDSICLQLEQAIFNDCITELHGGKLACVN